MWSKVLVDDDIDCEYMFRRREMVASASWKGKSGSTVVVRDKYLTLDAAMLMCNEARCHLVGGYRLPVKLPDIDYSIACLILGLIACVVTCTVLTGSLDMFDNRGGKKSSIF